MNELKKKWFAVLLFTNTSSQYAGLYWYYFSFFSFSGNAADLSYRGLKNGRILWAEKYIRTLFGVNEAYRMGLIIFSFHPVYKDFILFWFRVGIFFSFLLELYACYSSSVIAVAGKSWTILFIPNCSLPLSAISPHLPLAD